MLEPRLYQSAAIEAIYAALARYVYRQLLVLPTGTGKTVTFALLILDWLKRGGRALVLAHRDRLIQQAADKISKVVSWNEIGIVKAESNRLHANCVIASVQTLARSRRLSVMPKFDLVIVDEAHRSAARTYRRILDHVRHPETLLLGVTATPDRADGLGLDAVYDEVVYEISLLDAIDQGHLVDLRAVQVKIEADFNQLHTKKDSDGVKDFDEAELAKLMGASNWYQHVGEAWLRYAPERRTIAFVPRVAMAYRLADHMKGQGVTAAALDGATPLYTQRQTVAAFERGDVRMLVNCDLFVEGADIPSIDCVVMAKPTKSRGRYCQAVGRGTRPSPETGKVDCLILDLVGVSQSLDLCTAAGLIGARRLNENETLRQARERERKEDLETAEQADLLLPVEGELVGREVNLFNNRQIQKRGFFEWQINADAKRSKLHAAGHTFEIWREGSTAWYGFRDMHWKGKLNGRTMDYREARAKIEEEAKRLLFGDETALWRQKPASEKQIALMLKLRIPVPHECTSGQASDLIDAKFKKARAAA